MKLTKQDQALLKSKCPLPKEEIEEKLAKHYPVQYLIGNVSFFGFPIQVDERVLIPRFETEYLVDYLKNYLNTYQFKNPKIIDIGTGSGCIAIVLAKLTDGCITAIDIDESALALAKENAKQNNVSIQFKKLDILKEIPTDKYDIIISNPPYIGYKEQVDEETKFEPFHALYASNNGYAFYEAILKNAKNYLNSKSMIAFEIGANQKEGLLQIANTYFPEAIKIVKQDLNNKDRYFFLFNNCE